MMKQHSPVKKFLLIVFFLTFLTGCGLIPSAKYGIRQLQNADTFNEEGEAMQRMRMNWDSPLMTAQEIWSICRLMSGGTNWTRSS